jgi:hypothetical protein
LPKALLDDGARLADDGPGHCHHARFLIHDDRVLSGSMPGFGRALDLRIVEK